MTWFSCLLVARAAPPPDLAERWAEVEPLVRTHSATPVPLGPDDITEMMGGRAVARRYDTAAGAYATGAIYIDAPIAAVWVAINDAPHDETPRVSIERLPSPAGMRRVYTKIDLPFPLTDRQLVSEIRSNTALHEATSGRVWQRQWTLGDPVFAPTPDASGIWINENRGSWTLFDTGEGTLALFSIRTILGGAVPAAISQSWAVSTLRAALERLSVRSIAMPTHYVAGHEIVITPAGAELPIHR